VRPGTDYWATTQCLIAALIEQVLRTLPPAPVWECAAGDGRVAYAMRAAGRVVLASDIEPRRPDIERRDFLHDDPPQHGLIAITNPPFARLNRFLARGLQLLDTGKLTGLVLLVRWDALATAGRASAFNRAADILSCCWRPLWIEGSSGGGRWTNAWITWLPGHMGPPVTRFLRPERQRALPNLAGTGRHIVPGEAP
jgi:hypothetical protein